MALADVLRRAFVPLHVLVWLVGDRRCLYGGSRAAAPELRGPDRAASSRMAKSGRDDPTTGTFRRNNEACLDCGSYSTAQFLDWLKMPMASWGIYEVTRRRAEALEQSRNRNPPKQYGPSAACDFDHPCRPRRRHQMEGPGTASNAAPALATLRALRQDGSRPRRSQKQDLSGSRKSGSQWTRRWREADSNYRSPAMASSVGVPCHSTSGGVRGTGSGAAVDRAFSCSASHSMQPGANTDLAGGGLLCCAAVSASWR